MRIIDVYSNIQSYDIVIGNKILPNIKNYLKKKYSSILIISDENVSHFYANDLLQALRDEKVFLEVVTPGEQSKNINTYYDLLSKAISYGLDRKSLIIALGGGVIGDLAGFVAATYMRGIDFVQVPTTLLAHDSSVGGKVAINHENGKNLIGSFYPPVLVLFDTDTLSTLPPMEIRSGYAELIKEALISDEDFYHRLLATSIANLNTDSLIQFLEKGIRIKARIVEQDEKEAGIRQYLNLGHTLGHALEAKLGYGAISHGEAVAIGLLFALYVSEKELKINLPITQLRDWLTENNYPLTLSIDLVQDLIELMKHDKKAVNNQIQMVLLKGIGSPIVRFIDQHLLKDYLTSFIMLISGR